MHHLKDLEDKALAPDFWNDQNAARKVIDETNAVRAVVGPFQKLEEGLDEVDLLLELAAEEVDVSQQKVAADEAAGQLEGLAKETDALELKALLSGKLDANNVYLSLNAGAGGTESCDWADMLFRMYSRYAERNGFDVSVLDVQPGDEAGIKSAEMLVSGPFAYGYLKAERGVHRLVRISPYDSAKRRHTSFAALDVVAELDDSIEVEIKDEDLRVDTYRSSGAGGQHVNTTDSAVRITHQPSGIVVQCQAERSQHSNRNKAMKMLQARLYEWELDKQRKEMEKFYGNKGEIAWGSQIRSYVLQPYTLVKDLRTQHETGNVQAVLDGDLNGFIEAYLKKLRHDDDS
jgi:peptide chain release factor 2